MPIVLDCDPGHDDAIAIMLAAGSPNIDLLGICTVAGNQTLERTTLNALRVVSLLGLDIPVVAGCDRPLVAPLRTAGEIHGESGLDGPSFPSVVGEAEPLHAVEFLRRTIEESSTPITIVATGPLTNVSLLLRTYPHLENRIGQIVLMGGSTGRGNVTPYGEFNIVVDPEAADIVFRSAIPLTMCGLDVTHQALVTPEVMQQFGEIGTPLARTCLELMTFFAETYEEVFSMPEPPLHDPVAVARVIDPSIVCCVTAPVAIELTGALTRGATVVDLYGTERPQRTVEVAVGLDVPRFWTLVLTAVRALGQGGSGSRLT